LRSGDVLSTGTPAGVGWGRTPQLWMKPGDTIEVALSGLGTLRNASSTNRMRKSVKMMTLDTYVGASLAANAIWTLFDQRRYEDILSYLTPDCAWERTEGWRYGHEQLRASFLARPADVFTRHVVTNFTVEQAGDGRLQGRCYLIVYAAKTKDHDATQLMDQPYIIADIDFEFVQSHQRVLVSKINVHQAFAIESLIK
jgi:hypothetical protein